MGLEQAISAPHRQFGTDLTASLWLPPGLQLELFINACSQAASRLASRFLSLLSPDSVNGERGSIPQCSLVFPRFLFLPPRLGLGCIVRSAPCRSFVSIPFSDSPFFAFCACLTYCTLPLYPFLTFLLPIHIHSLLTYLHREKHTCHIQFPHSSVVIRH